MRKTGAGGMEGKLGSRWPLEGWAPREKQTNPFKDRSHLPFRSAQIQSEGKPENGDGISSVSGKSEIEAAP